MRALVDADNIAFACAASAENDSSDIAIARANDMVEGILHDASADEYELWLSGPNNFRYKVYPEYKANRLDAYRPKYEKDVRQYLVEHWHANLSDGCEADDMLGIRQHGAFGELNTIICHLDKDLNQIPGWHFNWELKRLGKIVRERKKYFVTPEEADYNFYYQLLVGDPTDNIKGVSGIGPKKAEAFLGSIPKQDWYSEIRNLYASEEELDMNAQCVYIWRKPNDNWRNIISDPTKL